MSGALIKNTCMLLLLFGGVVHASFGQKAVLNLDQIQAEVQKNYPLVKGKELLQRHNDLSLENIRVNYLPQLYANGKLSYQSDVTSSPLSGANSFGAPKDQYSLNLDVEQLIYNGGRTKSQLKLNEISTEIDIQNVEVKMFALRERVNDAYFSILLLRQSKSILKEKKKTVLASLHRISSAVKSGVMTEANQKVMESEVLLINQQIEEFDAAEKSALESLAELMNREMDFDIQNTSDEVVSKEIFLKNDELNERPEYKLYSDQRLLLNEKIELEKKNRMPVVTAFGQLGYGQPGYNQLSDEFDSYYMLGARLSWNIFDWKKSKRNQRKFNIQKEIIDTQESSFKKNQLVDLKKELNNISKFEILISKDDAIVELKEEVVRSSKSQLENGIITSSDYLEDLNQEVQAKLNREYHQIQLSQSIAEYKRILGKTEIR
ncbi:TolC family protein [Marinifilum sp. D714]|uniref:TolC family protein n=1 Tax=Marinifilum sp. D714 TaxID=2937523 RepID=UPI0027C8ACEC|nr:TolC family protein [Marinifilum sp. D714]MDQ2177335.1 TolC family protein [Marinifilum sp. D714]